MTIQQNGMDNTQNKPLKDRNKFQNDLGIQARACDQKTSQCILMLYGAFAQRCLNVVETEPAFDKRQVVQA